MGNLRTKKSILIKGWLFLVLGTVAAGMLIVLHWDLTTMALLAISIWAYCRFYYFAFYVIEHYVDSKYRFTGLLDFIRYSLSGRCVDRRDQEDR